MALKDNDRYKVLDCERKGVLGLPDGALKVWFCYWMFQNEAGASFPGNDAILAFTRQSEPCMTKWRKYLVASRWLIWIGQTAADMYAKKTHGAHQIKVYRVNDPTKEPDWKGWEYWDQWEPDSASSVTQSSDSGDGELLLNSSSTTVQPPLNTPATPSVTTSESATSLSESSASRLHHECITTAPSVRHDTGEIGENSPDSPRIIPNLVRDGSDSEPNPPKNLPQYDSMGQNSLPQKICPNIRAKKLPQSSVLSSGSVLDSDLDSDRSRSHVSTHAHQQPPIAEQSKGSTSNPRTEPNDNTVGSSTPHPDRGAAPEPRCGRIEVLGLNGEEYTLDWTDSKGKARTNRVKAKPQFMALTPETPCSICNQPLKEFGAGEAAHKECLSDFDQPRHERFWINGKIDYEVLDMDTPPPPAAPQLHPNADVLQQFEDRLKTSAHMGSKKQYMADGSAYPDEWHRMSAEEKRTWIAKHRPLGKKRRHSEKVSTT